MINGIHEKQFNIKVKMKRVFFCGVFLGCSRSSLLHGFRSWGALTYLPYGMWDISSLMRDQTHVPCIVRWILNHWASKQV